MSDANATTSASQLAYSTARDCDWRLYINPSCPDFEFFYWFYLIGGAVSAVLILVCTFMLSFRLYMQGKTAFLNQSSNISIIAFVVSEFFIVASIILSLTGGSPLAAEVFFLVFFLLWNLACINHTMIIINSLASGLKDHFYLPLCLGNPAVRRSITIVSLIYLSSVTLVLVPLSDYYYFQGDVATSAQLFTAGFGFFGINQAFIITALCFFFHHFRQAAAQRVAVISESTLKTENEEFRVLSMTVSKTHRAMVYLITATLVYLVFFLLLAFYPDFFANTMLSKAFCGLCFVFILVPALAIVANAIYIDCAKFKHQRSKNGSSSGGGGYSTSTRKASLEAQEPLALRKVSRDSSASDARPEPARKMSVASVAAGDPLEAFLEAVKE